METERQYHARASYPSTFLNRIANRFEKQHRERLNKSKRAALAFAVSIGMRISLHRVPNKKVLTDSGREHFIRENDGVITYMGGLSLELICHEIAHFQVASTDRRYLPDYGMYGISVSNLSKIIESSRKGENLIIPECIEDGRASILGDLHRRTFDPGEENKDNFIFGSGGMTQDIPCWKHADAKGWLIKHGFIVDGKPTSKLNTMTAFESFADYF